jgi:hypothetical protein
MNSPTLTREENNALFDFQEARAQWKRGRVDESTRRSFAKRLSAAMLELERLDLTACLNWRERADARSARDS